MINVAEKAKAGIVDHPLGHAHNNDVWYQMTNVCKYCQRISVRPFPLHLKAPGVNTQLAQS